ncbi:nitroreductase family protein [Paucibacter sp. APW11]|uniref:Nitroreductase family protein n=1 Tax=Roseateles aquae TaxID=3077235 RepID=A0ABU3P8L0_9BURK|nr:nitroreductase family protein [Paucibacter sp. APW11]MDT8998879.1 nitroreductase family protein [Paucibacter sp. APW11]
MNPSSAADTLSALLQRHRSIRRFENRPLDESVVDEVLAQAIAGSSSSGNLNTYSLVLSRDAERRARLHQLHFEQDMILQAPLLITFCADTRRTRDWLKLHQARDNFDNFHGFLVAAFDAMILAQSVALGFEARGLGICYLGTTLNAAAAIAEFLELPDSVFPVTSLAVGWPAESPAPRDRLPLSAYVHQERYQRHDDAALQALFAERDVKGLRRYQAMGPEMAAQWQALGLNSLAQFYTSELKYSPAVLQASSRDLLALLQARGFMNNATTEQPNRP